MKREDSPRQKGHKGCRASEEGRHPMGPVSDRCSAECSGYVEVQTLALEQTSVSTDPVPEVG